MGQKTQASGRAGSENRPQGRDEPAVEQGKRHAEWEQRDEDNKRRFTDQSGAAAQDLPDAEHGQNVIGPNEHVQRMPPQSHGGELGGEGGVRGDREIGDAAKHGNRGKN